MARSPDAVGEEAFDRQIARFERFSVGLVLLEDPGAELLRREVEEFAGAVRAHLGASTRTGLASTGLEDPSNLGEEHRRFLDSLEVLSWLLGIVERDGHGGNRQALGQYGKILTEALRLHRDRERTLGKVAAPSWERARVTPPGKP